MAAPSQCSSSAQENKLSRRDAGAQQCYTRQASAEDHLTHWEDAEEALTILWVLHSVPASMLSKSSVVPQQ